MKIFTHKNLNGTYIITIDNIVKHKDYLKIIFDIIESFKCSTELFLGFYKKDGFYLSKDEFLKYGNDIQSFFKFNGEYIELNNTKKHNFMCSDCTLVVCRVSNYKSILGILEKALHYYLETTLFFPIIDWKTFVESYKNYINITISDYVINDYTNFIFTYADSGDFSITFNPSIYDPQDIYAQIIYIITKYDSTAFK